MTSTIYSILRNYLICLFLLLLCSSVRAQENPVVQEIDTQRYLAMMLLNITEQKGQEIDIIKMGRVNGFNAVYLTIPWDKVYFNSPTETPNWARFDEQVELATSLGMKVALRIHLGRHSTRIKGFWEPSDSQFSNLNKPMLGGYQDTSFGFDNQPIVEKAAAFVKETAERYKYLQKDKKLLFMSITNTPTQEGEYPSSLITGGQENPAIYDYSPRMIKGFQDWLKENYKKVERLNFLWGTSFKSFDDAWAPSAAWDPSQSFRQRYGKDWYIYRHIKMKQYVEKMISTIKSADPAIRFVADYGSIFDSPSGVRGTMGYKSLNEKSDGIKVNDHLTMHDHRWSADIIRSDFPANFFVANELFPHASFDKATHMKQINEHFEHGGNMVAIVVSTTSQMSQITPIVAEAVGLWVDKPRQPLTYKVELGYKLSTAVEKLGAINTIYSEWAKVAYADPKNPQPVKIRLDEDLFTASYWSDASNHAPYVFRPIPMQVIAVNKDFTHTLPTDTFSDVDGKVVRMEVGTLPDWLRYQSGQLIGKPTALGDYRVLVKGIDDEGGVGEAYFTIRVDTRENANKPPTVNSTFSNQTVAINKAFTFTIPKDAFLDSDGTVNKVEVSELPSWLKFTDGVLSGTPTALGDYRIIVKAYDDLNAFVETYFTIKVVEPQYLNNPPFAQRTLPVKYATINEPFSYILPNDIFGDTDGWISAITIQNLPSWLDFTLNQFTGTPTSESENRLIIRAYDNAGAYVEIPFILRVEIPRLRFELVKGGRAVDQQIIRALYADDVIPYDSLPPLLNIFAYGNFDYDKVKFELRGPHHIKSSTSRFPYALFESEGGFPPFVGRYTLTVTATSRDSSVISNSIQFSISYGNRVNIASDIAEWNFYPNPVETVFNIKLPESQPGNEIEYFLINSRGQRTPIPVRYIESGDHLANIDLASMDISSGIYFIRLESKGSFLHQFKIFKK